MSRPLLRRAWLPWTLALLVAAASAGAIAWLGSERDELLRQTAETREDLAEARSQIDLRRQSIQQERTRAERLTKALETCEAAIRHERALLSVWIDHLAASRDGNFDLAEEIYEGIIPVWREANRSGRRCFDRAGEEGVL